MRRFLLIVTMISPISGSWLMADDPMYRKFLAQYCYDCHRGETTEAGLDLEKLSTDLNDAELFKRWVKIYDRIESDEMPPQEADQPTAEERTNAVNKLQSTLRLAEQNRLKEETRTGIRRLTREEYENTIRDLFQMEGIALKAGLPKDGSAHGFDNNSDALDFSHVNMARYMEAADHVLEMAICTQPEAPEVRKEQLSLTGHYYIRLLIANNGGSVLLKDKKPDPDFLPTSEHQHIDQGAHERLGLYTKNDSSVGVFRHEDDSFRPWFQAFAAVHPGRYRVRTSLWSYTWDKGEVKPSRGVEAARLSVMQLTGRGRGQGHPSYVIGYYDAPSLEGQIHEFDQWLNMYETIGFNVASLAPVHIYHQYKRNVMSFTGPGIACDWLELEGPLHDVWPPVAHQRLFGDLPLVAFPAPDQTEVTLPKRVPPRQIMTGTKNKPDPYQGNFTVRSEKPLEDAEQLLSDFLPRAFRRPVSQDVIDAYVHQVEERLNAGDCFELAMRWVYRAALCSPDFLYHVELPGELDDFALANRLSYFLWNSQPDDHLRSLAEQGILRKPDVLKSEIERLLVNPKSERFVKNFLGQWLRLRDIAANDPDGKLYPEFSPYLQDSMIAETEAFFRELLEKDLDATHLIQSDFAMLNEKLAVHYGIEGVSGPTIRRVELPKDCPRGGFLTHASILKITANGTTTSPVPRGAFVMDRLLGQPPDPPPPNIPAVEPDVRGATTIRELLDKHRNNTVCAGCHAKIDPAGFALESFDVIGGFRDRYRTVEVGDQPERGSIDPFIHLGFKLGPEVDSSGVLPDGREFEDVLTLQTMLADQKALLTENLARQFTIYATGRDVSFSDREKIDDIVNRTLKQGGGVRALIHEVVQSELFQTR